MGLADLVCKKTDDSKTPDNSIIVIVNYHAYYTQITAGHHGADRVETDLPPPQPYKLHDSEVIQLAHAIRNVIRHEPSCVGASAAAGALQGESF